MILVTIIAGKLKNIVQPHNKCEQALNVQDNKRKYDFAKKRGGCSINAEYEPKYCLNKISGYFRKQLPSSPYVHNHEQRFTSNAMQSMQMFKCDGT